MEVKNIPVILLIALPLFTAIAEANGHHPRHPRIVGAYHPPSPQLISLCSKTSYPQLCISTLSRFVLPGCPNDNMTIFKTSVKAATDKARRAVKAANRLLLTEKNAAVVESVKSCRAYFLDAVDDIQNAEKAILSRDYRTITSSLSSAINQFVTCDDEFEGQNNLRKINSMACHILDNSLAIAEYVQWS